ncbi:MAG: hypothetical protein BWY60_01090 [Actinobacteria bacterium ADurb.Bin346]|nr:MAG: hypothetical protein BWY60_01090 [Actinobacteria bacterium ADurb.Bin346]
MDGKLILGFLNYLMLSLIFIFGLISLAVKDQKKKLSFLFFMLFCSGILSYLFFAKIAFMLPGIMLLFFCLSVLIMVAGQEYFGYGKPLIKAGKEVMPERHSRGWFNPGVIINLLLSLILCIGAGVLFYYFNRDFYQDLVLVDTFKVAEMQQIVNNIGLNYMAAILIIFCGLASSFFWFLCILDKKGDKS